MTTQELRQRLAPLLDKDSVVTELELPAQKVWRLELPGRTLTVCHRSIDIPVEAPKHAEVDELRTIKTAVSFLFQGNDHLLPNQQRYSNRQLCRLMIDVDTVLFGKVPLKDVQQYIWLNKLLPGEFEQKWRHGFSQARGFRRIDLVDNSNRSDQVAEMRHQLQSFVDRENPAGQLHIQLKQTAGLAEEILTANVEKIVRQDDGRVVMHLRLITDSQLNHQMRQGTVGRLAFNSYDPVEKQLHLIHDIKIEKAE